MSLNYNLNKINKKIILFFFIFKKEALIKPII